jgi:hypothetical protein
MPALDAGTHSVMSSPGTEATEWTPESSPGVTSLLSLPPPGTAGGASPSDLAVAAKPGQTAVGVARKG